ncbi:MAG TPA: CsgG/HfaB family protein [Longimicrobiaceae bacterium]|nr:CsgG/HfaB family protein [Longimicrobiaceae bacterium]
MPPSGVSLLGLALLSAGCAVAAPVPSAPSASEIPRLEAELAGDTTDVPTRVRLGAAYRAADRAGEARGVLERAVAREPENAGAVLLLGLTYEDLGLHSQARELYERYERVGRSPEVREALRSRLALLQRRELEDATRAALAREAELARTPPQSRSVAVFPFLYAGSDSALRPLSRALADMLATDLSQTSRVTVLERARVQMLLDEMKLSESGLVHPSTAVRSGHLLGAEHVVQGRFAGTERALELQAAVVRSTTSGSPSAAPLLARRGEARRLFDLEKAMAFDLFRALGVDLTPAERELVNRRPTENLQAVLAYGRGLEAADAGDFPQAVRHFTEATRFDPGFAAARQQAERATASASAQRTTTRQLAQRGSGELGSPAPEALSAESLVPSLLGRDPASEALGTEGIGRREAVVEIIVRRP